MLCSTPSSLPRIGPSLIHSATWQERTTYFFDVKPSSLRGALDRFAQFFISPLVKSHALEREVQAVDNEFSGGWQLAAPPMMHCDSVLIAPHA